MKMISTDLIGVFNRDTPIKSIYKGTELVWELSGSYIRGKFTDDSTEEDWWYYRSYKSNLDKEQINISEYVDPITKEFKMKVDKEYTLNHLFYFNQKLEKIYEVPIGVNITSLAYMFYYCSNLDSIEGVENWKVDKVEDMTGLFCRTKLSNLDLSNWKVENVQIMDSMFSNCQVSRLEGLQNWNTSNLYNIMYMFRNTNVTELDLSNWNLSKLNRSLYYLFYQADNLITLKLTNWDFSNIGTVNYDTFNCKSLVNIIGPIYNIKNNINLYYTPSLSIDSVMVFINGLTDVTEQRTLTLNNTLKKTLTEEQIALATSKGWSIA